MTVMDTRPTTPVGFLSLEITSSCQFTCPGQCYAEAGPTKGHGSMATENWHRLIDEAATDLGTSTVQFIGGEPSLHPAFTELVKHALRVGLHVRVHSNFYKVRAEHWALFEDPQVSVATSYYSDIAAEHDAITGRDGSHTVTRAAIVEAVRRGVKLRVAIVDHGNGQRAEQARAEMEGLGISASVDPVRPVGRAAGGRLPSTSALCGRCGDGKAAVLPNGQVSVCEIGRFLAVGNVQEAPLASILASPEWAQARASVPARTSADPCGPDCGPSDDSSSGGGSCQPMG